MEAARWSICTHTKRCSGSALRRPWPNGHSDVRTARWTHTNQAPTSTRPTPPCATLSLAVAAAAVASVWASGGCAGPVTRPRRVRGAWVGSGQSRPRSRDRRHRAGVGLCRALGGAVGTGRRPGGRRAARRSRCR